MINNMEGAEACSGAHALCAMHHAQYSVQCGSNDGLPCMAKLADQNSAHQTIKCDHLNRTCVWRTNRVAYHSVRTANKVMIRRPVMSNSACFFGEPPYERIGK